MTLGSNLSPDSRRERLAFLLLLGVLVVLFFGLLIPAAIAVVLAVILVTILYPLYQFLVRLLRGWRGGAAFLTTLIIFLFLVLPAGLATTLVTDQLLQYVRHLTAGGGIGMLTATWVTNFLPALSERISSHLGFQFDLTNLLTSAVQTAARTVTGFSPRVVLGTAKFLFNFVIMHIAVYFLFLEGPRLFQWILHVSPLKEEHEQKLAREVRGTIIASVYGYVATAVAQGLLAALGYWIAGVEVPLVFGALTFVTSFVPLAGATIIWVPTAVTLLAVGHLKAGIFLLIYGAVVVSSLDNIIKPLVIKGKTDIHPLLVFLAIFGGLNMMGPIGILVGPVIMAVLLACLKIYREEYL